MVETVKEAMKEARPARSLVDIKAIGKPPPFKNEESKFQAWSMKFKEILRGIWPQARNVLEWAAESETPLTYEEIKEYWTDGADENGKMHDVKEMGQQIQGALLSLLEGEALDLVVGVTEGGGLEAWRKTTRRFDPLTVGRSRNMLQAILTPGTFKCSELLAAIEHWEQQVATYARRRGPGGLKREVAEDIKMGILQQIGPNELKTHLFLNQSRFATYEKMREEIIGCVAAKVGTAYEKKHDHVESFQPWQGSYKGKGKGKGKDDAKGKGKGKGKYDAKGSGKSWNDYGAGKNNSKGNWPPKYESKAKFEGYCDTCGKYGHKKVDCWSGQQGGGAGPKGYQKGKGKGKGDDKGKEVYSVQEGTGAWTWAENAQAPMKEQGAGCLGICAFGQAGCGDGYFPITGHGHH
jgi:hypothetical protein